MGWFTKETHTKVIRKGGKTYLQHDQARKQEIHREHMKEMNIKYKEDELKRKIRANEIKLSNKQKALSKKIKIKNMKKKLRDQQLQPYVNAGNKMIAFGKKMERIGAGKPVKKTRRSGSPSQKIIVIDNRGRVIGSTRTRSRPKPQPQRDTGKEYEEWLFGSSGGSKSKKKGSHWDNPNNWI